MAKRRNMEMSSDVLPACLLSLPGLTPQVVYTRLAAHKNAQLGQARVAMQSIPFAKASYEEDGPPEIGFVRQVERNTLYSARSWSSGLFPASKPWSWSAVASSYSSAGSILSFSWSRRDE
jgi:hypothetical protein